MHRSDIGAWVMGQTDGWTDGRIAALLITPLWAGHNYQP